MSPPAPSRRGATSTWRSPTCGRTQRPPRRKSPCCRRSSSNATCSGRCSTPFTTPMSSPGTCRLSPGSRRGDGACRRCPAASCPRRPPAGGQGPRRLRPLGTGAGAERERHRGRGAAALRRRAHGRGARRRARGPFRRRPRAHRRRGHGAADGSRRKAHGGAVTIAPPRLAPPLGLLAELTHRCPLSCPYCSNPIDLERRSAELDTATWQRVFDEAAALGVLQIHLSGGEPTARADIVALTRHAAQAGLYTNLITSGIALDGA